MGRESANALFLQPMGERSGVRSLDRASGGSCPRRRLNGPEFTTLVAGSWVGTTIAQSASLEVLIREVLESGRAKATCLSGPARCKGTGQKKGGSREPPLVRVNPIYSAGSRKPLVVSCLMVLMVLMVLPSR